MNVRAFQFALQASLDKASADLRAKELAHAGSISLLRDEEERQRIARQALDLTLAKVATAREELASPRAGLVQHEDLARFSRCLTGLRAVADREREALAIAGKRVDLAAERVRIRKRELDAAFNQAQAMQRLKDARQAEHRISARRAAERVEEENALRAWEKGKT